MSYRLFEFGRMKDRTSNLHHKITAFLIKVCYHICTVKNQNGNKLWKSYCVLSFDMSWHDISKCYPSLPLRVVVYGDEQSRICTFFPYYFFPVFFFLFFSYFFPYIFFSYIFSRIFFLSVPFFPVLFFFRIFFCTIFSRTIFFPVLFFPVLFSRTFSKVATFEIQRFKISVSCFSSTCRYSTVHVPCGISI